MLFFRKSRIHTPYIAEMSYEDSSASALRIIYKHYKMLVPIQEICEEMDQSPGNEWEKVIYVLRKRGLDVKKYTLDEFKKARKVGNPYIGRYKNDKFIVIDGIDKNRVYVNDPESFDVHMSWNQFLGLSEDIVYEVITTSKYKKEGKELNCFQYLWPSVAIQKQRIATIICISILTIIVSLATASFSKVFIDQFMVAGNISWSFFWLWATMLIFLLISAHIHFFEQTIFNRLEMSSNWFFGESLFYKLFRLPKFYLKRTNSLYHILSIQYTTVAVSYVLSSQSGSNIMQTVLNIFSSFIYICVIFLYDFSIGCVTFAVILFNCITLPKIMQLRRASCYAAMSRFREVIIPSALPLKFVEIIKIENLKSFFFQKVAFCSDREASSRQAAAKYSLLATILPNINYKVAQGLVLSIGAWRVIKGELSIGGLTALQTLVSLFFTPINTLIAQTQNWQIANIFCSFSIPFLYGKKDNHYLKKYDSNYENKARIKGEIYLENISIKNKEDEFLFQNLNLKIPHGIHLGILGHSQSGKTLLSQLIYGTVKNFSGSLKYDDKKYEEHPRPILENTIHLVDGSSFNIKASIFDNICLFKPNATMFEVTKATKSALLHDDIMKRQSNYYDILSEEGRTLSRGQRQQLEIAKALVFNPNVIVFDETFKVIDEEKKKEIILNLSRYPNTIIITSHEASLLVQCDIIIVLKDHQIIFKGSYQELKKTPLIEKY